jgi:hypothetical protein
MLGHAAFSRDRINIAPLSWPGLSWLVPAIPVGGGVPFPTEMAGESSPHAASVCFGEDGRAKRALRPAMTRCRLPLPGYDPLFICADRSYVKL